MVSSDSSDLPAEQQLCTQLGVQQAYHLLAGMNRLHNSSTYALTTPPNADEDMPNGGIAQVQVDERYALIGAPDQLSDSDEG